ncbi:RHS repeat-associated core domain-containing protein, partial [Catellatospora sp. NPDC049609]|uniref:RHS repeat-associated core domain-containing protein n=1 Tax=Catellatospora sp. NPDC049609 TaxID=3155505 RepID=UPI00342A6AD0
HYTTTVQGHHVLALAAQDAATRRVTRYGAFGEVLAAYTADSDGDGQPDTDKYPQEFNGKDHDPVSDLHDYGFRSYDPLALQWTSADPLFLTTPDLDYTNPTTANLYTYTANNPIGMIDPNGLDTCEADPAECRFEDGSSDSIYECTTDNCMDAPSDVWEEANGNTYIYGEAPFDIGNFFADAWGSFGDFVMTPVDFDGDGIGDTTIGEAWLRGQSASDTRGNNVLGPIIDVALGGNGAGGKYGIKSTPPTGGGRGPGAGRPGGGKSRSSSESEGSTGATKSSRPGTESKQGAKAIDRALVAERYAFHYGMTRPGSNKNKLQEFAESMQGKSPREVQRIVNDHLTQMAGPDAKHLQYTLVSGETSALPTKYGFDPSTGNLWSLNNTGLYVANLQLKIPRTRLVTFE